MVYGFPTLSHKCTRDLPWSGTAAPPALGRPDVPVNHQSTGVPHLIELDVALKS